MFFREKILSNGNKLFIREAAGIDASDLLKYLERISGETDFLTFGPGEFRMTEDEERFYLDKCLQAENCLYLLALVDNEICGTLSFEAGIRPRNRHTGEFGVTVLEKYWGNGIATVLIRALIEWAENGGIIKKINLRVRTDNRRAVLLYEKLGFIIEGKIIKELMINQKYYDHYWMGLELSD